MRQHLFHNTTFMAILSIIIIIAIVFMVTGLTTADDSQSDSAGKAYSIYSYQDSWTDHPITKSNRMEPLTEEQILR